MNETVNGLNVANLAFVEELFQDYLRDPSSVARSWREFFDELTKNDPSAREARTEPSLPAPSLYNPYPRLTNGHGSHAQQNGAPAPVMAELPGTDSIRMAVMQDRVDQLVRAFRVRGHKLAQIDPLELPRPTLEELTPEYYGLTEEDLDRPFSTRTIKGAGTRTLRKILERLRNTYCRSIAVQFMHIDDLRIRHWLQEQMEGTENRIKLSRERQLRVLECLTSAVIFEQFIHRKFTGYKRFSLEGAETLIPLLDQAIETAGDQGVEDIILGMAHRGRLNVLANIMGKSPREIFFEFEDRNPEMYYGGGDVKYHLGYSRDWTTANGKQLHVSLCFNPSHLEFVNPVALGRVRAKQDRKRDYRRERSLAILVHGDAAFAGEGVVQETLNMSQLPGYETGGTLHIVVNNQLGFTTGPEQGRSSPYATDIAKMLEIPIFHVNGEDPEAVAQAVHLSMEFRRLFRRDVVIDMYCYRKYGHNEGDDPSFTQPLMYHEISKLKSVREGYVKHLLNMGGVTREEADAIKSQLRDMLQNELESARAEDYAQPKERVSHLWSQYFGGTIDQADTVETAVRLDRLKDLLTKQTETPEDFQPNPKVERLLGLRKEMAAGERPLDWASAEALAFASLVTEGRPVRLTGQDSERGTFSQRHAVLHDYEDGHTYVPLRHLSADQAPFHIYNSPLNETGAMGFDYGYSLDFPAGLVVWEAQFGDFCNAAQVIIDQFIVSAEDKWNRLSGLVLLLPHGFEGAGPEHSSARLERFLVLAAEDNIQVANATTPAQYFHLLRRQVLRFWRKPLIVLTPKKLLRYPLATSSLEDLSKGRFQEIIPDPVAVPEQTQRVLLCSGKVYYDLFEQREKLGLEDKVAIVRVEQLYPLPEKYLMNVLEQYPEHTPTYWVQEEPENMGAWRHFWCTYGPKIGGKYPLFKVARVESASPATGSAASHAREQQELLDKAFADL